MPLYLTEDQIMVRDTARHFMAAEGGIAQQLRKYRDMNCKDGFGHALWKQLAELGFTGILVDEADGGLGHVEAGIVLEEIGRNLTPSPFLITAVAVVQALRGSPLRERWLPGILSGDTVAALAIDEGPKHRPEAIAMATERSGNGFRLSGRKQFVVQGASADFFVVAANTGEGLTLFVVQKEASGLTVEGVRLAAFRPLALPFERVGTARRHHQLVARLVEFGAGIFHHRGLGRMRLTSLQLIHEAFGHRAECHRIHIEPRNVGAEQGIVGKPLLERRAEAFSVAAKAHAADHFALMAQEVFGDVPALVDLAYHLILGDLHIVEEGLAERRIAGDEQDRPG